MSSLVKSAGIVSGSTFISRIFGLTRDMLMATFFGASGQTDAFYVAFKIPNLFRRFVGEGALTISFIPVYTEYLVTKGEREALEVAQRTLSLLLIILLGLVAFGEVFSLEIINTLAPGIKDPEIIGLATILNRIMFPFLFLVSLVAFSMGVLNSHKHFFAPAFAPVLLNAGIITGILVFSRFFSEPLYGVAAGVIFGGILQVLLQIPYMFKEGFRMKFVLDLKHPGMRKIFRLLLPALFGMAIVQINSMVLMILATFLEPGSVTYIYYSDRLSELVQGVFIISISSVILPEMSRMSAVNDISRLKELYISSLKSAFFVAIPAAAALMAVGVPILSVIFMRGAFTPEDVTMTYMALFYAAAGICSIAVLRLTTPTFFSLHDSVTPVVSSTVNLIVNAGLGYILMHTSLKHAGLTLALSIASTVQVIILVVALRRKIGTLGLKKLLLPLVKNLFSAACMVFAVRYAAGYIDWFAGSFLIRVSALTGIVVLGAAVYAFLSLALKTEEAHYAINKLKRK